MFSSSIHLCGNLFDSIRGECSVNTSYVVMRTWNQCSQSFAPFVTRTVMLFAGWSNTLIGVFLVRARVLRWRCNELSLVMFGVGVAGVSINVWIGVLVSVMRGNNVF